MCSSGTAWSIWMTSWKNRVFQISQPGFGRFVTLAGPDWQVRTTPADIAEAAIIDDVVGVYTTLVDVNSL
jgi:hypothetical protein